jgi:hypothetical protein
MKMFLRLIGVVALCSTFVAHGDASTATPMGKRPGTIRPATALMLR